MSMNYRRRWRGTDFGQVLSGYKPGQARLRPATYYDRNSEVGPDAQARAMVDRLSRLEQSLKLRDEASRQFADRQGRPAPQRANAPRRPSPFTEGTDQFAGASGQYDVYETPNGRAYVDTRTGNVFINGQLFSSPGNAPGPDTDPLAPPAVAGLPEPGTLLPDGSTFLGTDEFGTPMVRTADGQVVAGSPEQFGGEEPPPMAAPEVAAPLSQPEFADQPTATETPGMIPTAPPPMTAPPPAPAFAPVDESSIPPEYRWMFGLGPQPTSGLPPQPPAPVPPPLLVPGVAGVAGPPTPGSVPVAGSSVYGAAPAVATAPAVTNPGGTSAMPDPGSQDYTFAGPPTPPPVTAAPEPPPAYDPEDPSTWVLA